MVDQCPRPTVEAGDVRATAGTGDGEYVGLAVAVDVPGADADAAGEAHVVGEEAREPRLGVVLPGIDADVGSAAGVGADDDVGEAVAVDVAGRHEAAAGEVH